MIDPDETIARPQAPDIAETETLPPGESAAELVRILDRYMAAVQAGEAPDRARLLAGADPNAWGIVLRAGIVPSRFPLSPVVFRSMQDLDGDGVGDVVVSSRQLPSVFALSALDRALMESSARLGDVLADPATSVGARAERQEGGVGWPRSWSDSRTIIAR